MKLKNRLRLAPSPTGSFHIGTARTALFNWLYARKTDGKFLVRIEDTDTIRSKPEHTKNILEGLNWLGLHWDEEPIKQSQRIDIHKSSIQKLLDKGLAYRCFTSEEETRLLREDQKKRGLPPKHDNRHRNLTKEEAEEFISQGRTSVIRFIIEDHLEIKWKDLIRGEIIWYGRDLGGDMVLSRRAKGYEIGEPLYNLAVVIDDNFMKISHVVRGEDHISNTAKQILIYEALEYVTPVFSHTPLILNDEGKKLSKRDSVTSIDDFKKLGYLPEALTNYMALLGWSPRSGESEIQPLKEIAKNFDLNCVNKSGAKFNWEKLNWINSQYIKNLDLEKLYYLSQKYWSEKGWKEPSKNWGLNLITLLQDSLVLLNDIPNQSEPFFVKPNIQNEAKEFLKKDEVQNALKCIYTNLKNDNKSYNSTTAKSLLEEISKKNQIKKGILMRSLRVALFGCLSGPDLIQSWVLLSQNREDLERIERCLI
tara:strand:+ start:412 stop:1848 length:1437 start_codon:yes stop_codon:yes gene_type:complete